LPRIGIWNGIMLYNYHMHRHLLELCAHAITHCPNILFCTHYCVNNEECTNKTKYAREYYKHNFPA
jgi:hypothetical protein